MSRFRANTAPSEEDRQIATHVDLALREIDQALSIARRTRSAGYRGRRVERDLGRVRNALNEIGTIAPRYGGGDDPDLVSEDERNRLARERREELREGEG